MRQVRYSNEQGARLETKEPHTYVGDSMTKQWGGSRRDAGPPRKHLHLDRVDKDAPRDLAQLTRRWRRDRHAPDLTEEAVVIELVREALKNPSSSVQE